MRTIAAHVFFEKLHVDAMHGGQGGHISLQLAQALHIFSCGTAQRTQQLRSGNLNCLKREEVIELKHVEARHNLNAENVSVLLYHLH